MRDSFIMYTENAEQIDMLNDEQAGVLLKAVMHYQMGLDVPEMDGMVSIVFSVLRQRLDRDSAKYEEVCEKRKEAGRKAKKANAVSEEAKKANAFSDGAKEANAFSEEQKKQMHPDNDPDNDNDPDIKEKVNQKEKRRSPFRPPTLEEVKEYCKERGNHVDAERFVDFYSAKSWMIGKNKMSDWKAAVRTWERDVGKTDARKPNSFQYEGRQRSPDEYRDLEAQLLGQTSQYAGGTA
jgi:hypothetical protein